MRKLTLILFLIAATGMLSGCHDAANVVLHEPGIYMGSDDSLLAKGSQASVLSERFQAGQIDR